MFANLRDAMKNSRTALVIGNADYPGAALKNPANDAIDVAKRLETFGFSVRRAVDCSNKEMDLALKAFKRDLADAEVGLFFFAGHGIQIEGINYLIALDTDTSSETDAKHSSLSLDKVIDTMEKAPTSTSIIMLDACRNNPFERGWHRSAATRGLASVYAPRGTLVAFATSPGQVASDGKGRNGSYTEALLQHIDAEDCTIEAMFKRVRNTLSAATKQKQISWEHTSLAGEFFFNLSVGARIDAYGDTALSDSLLILDESRASHRVIRKLKVLTWSQQNAAIDEFTPAAARKFNVNSLFVIGRNVYQAACGNANSALAYIKSFVGQVQGMGEDRRKAVLDGMLFEIFFDSNGRIREVIKGRYFDEVFQLQRHAELSESFEFISECLLPYVDRFHALPGKKHAVPVDVVLRAGDSKVLKVEGVFIASVNILWVEDADLVDEDQNPMSYKTMDRDTFELFLAEELIVPSRLLTVTYSPGKTNPASVRFPKGFTVRKRRT